MNLGGEGQTTCKELRKGKCHTVHKYKSAVTNLDETNQWLHSFSVQNNENQFLKPGCTNFVFSAPDFTRSQSLTYLFEYLKLSTGYHKSEKLCTITCQQKSKRYIQCRNV